MCLFYLYIAATLRRLLFLVTLVAIASLRTLSVARGRLLIASRKYFVICFLPGFSLDSPRAHGAILLQPEAHRRNRLMPIPHKKLKTDPLRARKHWWLEPGFLFVVVLYLGSGVLFIWWISYLEQTVASIILAVFWVCVLPVVVFLARRMIYDTHWVDQRIVQKTKQDIVDHRTMVRKEFIQTELEILSRGERSPVLDIWRLNSRLADRHPFFTAVETIWIDPSARELQIRLQLDDVPALPGDAKKSNPLFIDTAHFLSIAAGDPYLAMLKRFFNTVVLEAYALRENDQHLDEPFPFLSILIPPEILAKLPFLQPATVRDLSILGDARFAGGVEVEPHRHIEGRKSHGK